MTFGHPHLSKVRLALALAALFTNWVVFLYCQAAEVYWVWTTIDLAVVAGVFALVFWGDRPNWKIFAAGGLMGVTACAVLWWFVDPIFWDSTGGLPGFIFWGHNTIFVWKVASTIRSKDHPQEYNPHYLRTLPEYFKEVPPNAYPSLWESEHISHHAEPEE